MTLNGKEYDVLKLLGKGKGGYSYLVTDGIDRFVLKQIHHEPCDYYQFGDKLASELRDYERLKQIGIRMPVLFEVDSQHERLLKQFINGPTVYDLVLHENLDRSYIDQIQQMCQLLYVNGLNIDYFPTNFVVENGILNYIDYECNIYDPKWNFENWGIKYWSKTELFLDYAASRGDL